MTDHPTTNKTFYSVVGLLLTALGLAIGVGFKVLGDRMTVQTELATQNANMQAMAEDIGDIEKALSVLAENSGEIKVLNQRVEQLERRVDRLETSHD